MHENDFHIYGFHIFVLSDLELWPLDLKFALLVSIVQRYVHTKLEVSVAFIFRDNRMHRTDGQAEGWVQRLTRPSAREGLVKTKMMNDWFTTSGLYRLYTEKVHCLLSSFSRHQFQRFIKFEPGSQFYNRQKLTCKTAEEQQQESPAIADKPARCFCKRGFNI